jgi:hypothetical protein
VVGHGEGGRPLPPRIFAGHKRGGATVFPPRSADFFEPFSSSKEPFFSFFEPLFS